MPGHYGGGKGKKKAPKGTHRMPDGTLMTGSTHTKDSKPVKKAKGGTGKGSKAMKEKMAKLRAMKKKK